MRKPACTDPKHHVHGAADFVAAVEAACHARGLRLTPVRARVLGLIADAGMPVKAYDLLERLRNDRDADGEGSGAAAPPTVYRALDFLLANGFILTALLWGSAAAFLIDRRVVAASVVLAVCGLLSLFGFIHSVLPSGGVYLPWQVATTMPFHWAVGYTAVALLVLALSRSTAFRESTVDTHA